MPTADFSADAILANRGFTADAVILGNRLRHDRTLDHTGVQNAETVVLSATIGPYAAGSTVQSVLEDMVARLLDLDANDRHYGTFLANAFILPHFWANAVIKRLVSSSFTLNATIGTALAFTINASISGPSTNEMSFAAEAFIV